MWHINHKWWKKKHMEPRFPNTKSNLLDCAFYNRELSLGPKMILTNNCQKERNALITTCPLCVLLLSIFYILQLWRWLLDKNQGIDQSGRPYITCYILGLFTKALYSEMQDGSVWRKVRWHAAWWLMNNIQISFTALKLYEEREAFTLCFCSELIIWRNCTNNFVLKDYILRTMKEHNVVGLVYKLTTDLKDHYKDKVLP